MHMTLINPKRRKGRKRSASRKASSRTTRRASTRRTTRRASTRRATRRVVRRRKATAPVARSRRRRGGHRRGIRKVSMRGGRTVTLSVRNPRRRSGRGGGGLLGKLGLGNVGGELRGLFSKENLTVAAGGVAATVVTQYLLNKRRADGKPMLPMPSDPNTAKAATVAYAVGVGATVLTNFILSRTKADGTSLLPMPATNVAAAKIAYAVGIPFVGALVSRRFNPSLSRGMLLGGLINGITAAWQQYGGESWGKVTGVKLYLDPSRTAGVGRTAAGYMPTNVNPRRTNGVGLTFGPGFSKTAF